LENAKPTLSVWTLPQMESRIFCKKLSSVGAPSEKLCPVYSRYLKLHFWEAQLGRKIQRRLGQGFPIICNRYLPDDETMRGTVMQGKKNTRRLATYLGLARREFTQGG
jgi:hypothetical protein